MDCHEQHSHARHEKDAEGHQHHEHAHGQGCNCLNVAEASLCGRGLCNHIEHIRAARALGEIESMYNQEIADPSLPMADSSKPGKKKKKAEAAGPGPASWVQLLLNGINRERAA